MSSKHDLTSAITDIVEQYVPKGVDSELHVDRRETMSRIIFDLVDKKKSSLTLGEIIIMCKYWKEYLYQRSAYLN